MMKPSPAVITPTRAPFNYTFTSPGCVGVGGKTALMVALGVWLAWGLWPTETASACTTVGVGDRGGPLVGKNYDWHMDRGFVVVNKRGVSKRALTIKGSDKPARWTSKLASITFNQFGREMPNGGMNEAGLVVEIMWLASSRYPRTDDRPVLNELQWIQYQLDNFRSTAEVVAAAPKLRVSPVHAKVHYMVCDGGGVCATFEYVGGKLVVTSSALLVRTLTNSTYADSARALARHKGFGGKRAIPTSASSLDRFVRASAMARATKTHDVESTFAILDGTRQPDGSSVWQIVYDQQKKRIYWRTNKRKTTAWLDFADIAPGCRQPVRFVDVHAKPAANGRARLAPWTPHHNEKLVAAAFDELGLPALLVPVAANYPTSTACSAP